MRILVVEDEAKVASFIQRALAAEQHRVDAVGNGADGLARALAQPYDLIVLDVMLPQRDGMSVVAALRAQGRTMPILLLTARASIEDRVAGLDSGADDYLVKPFAVAELVARVRALLRRNSPSSQPQLALADLRLDPATRSVTRARQRIDLTAKEYALLEYFLRHQGRVLSRAVIAQHVWGVDFDTFTNVIDVYVNYLRRKIDTGFSPRLLHTVRGAGYVMKVPESASASVARRD